jgi:hypothetical protein
MEKESPEKLLTSWLGERLREKLIGLGQVDSACFAYPFSQDKEDPSPLASYLYQKNLLDNLFFGSTPSFRQEIVDYFYTDDKKIQGISSNFARSRTNRYRYSSGDLLGQETIPTPKYPKLPKMCSVQSSAALICNLLARPRKTGEAFMSVQMKPGIFPAGQYKTYLEYPLRTLKNSNGAPTHPAMADALLYCGDTLIVVESKLKEYLSGEHEVLSSPAYLDRKCYWLSGEPEAQAPQRFIDLFKQVNAQIANFEIGFDGLQLLRHALGICNELSMGNPDFKGIKHIYLMNSVWSVPLDSPLWRGQDKWKALYQPLWEKEADPKHRDVLGETLTGILTDCYPGITFQFLFLTAKEFADCLDLEDVKNEKGLGLGEYLQRYWL